jgi:selenide, water dikinase
VLRSLPKFDDPNYLNREQHFSDAGIYRISETHALVQTVDFFTPIVDDPYLFGQIAAANALSDVYAMGGKPLTALNIICFPISCQPLEIMKDILRGGYDKVKEASAVVVGGHSIEDPEPKYGLSVTGLVEISKLISGSAARPGDLLVLTKPIGTGIINTAVKGNMITESAADEVIHSMAALNANASAAMIETGVMACTDITGFSLLGHLHEMLVSSSVSAELEFNKIPLYPQVEEMAAMGMIPGGAYRNLDYVLPHIHWKGSAERKDEALIIMADPQTSGGLLAAVSPGKSDKFMSSLKAKNIPGWIVGRITANPGNTITIS